MSQRRSSALCLAAAGYYIPATALACCLVPTRSRSSAPAPPGALELITGKFLRHTPEFYYWRIDDRVRKLASKTDNLAFYDNMAVASARKTGQHDKAIETILIKDKKKPGVYETEWNLGTFLMVNSKLEEGAQTHRRGPPHESGRPFRAGEISEAAGGTHDRASRGREDGPAAGQGVGRRAGFVSHSPLTWPAPTLSITTVTQDWTKRNAEAVAIKGILGMMVATANYDSPVLLEVL